MPAKSITPHIAQSIFFRPSEILPATLRVYGGKGVRHESNKNFIGPATCVEMRMRTQCQCCTACIVFTSGSLRPAPMRSKRKSHQPSSNLQAIFWQTPSKYRGPHINDMRWKQPRSDDTKQIHGSEKFAKADPKAGSKIRSKNRSPHKGPPLCADKGADA